MFAGAGWFALLGIQFPGRCEIISATARCRVRTVSLPVPRAQRDQVF